jgi:hypothetical protein
MLLSQWSIIRVSLPPNALLALSLQAPLTWAVLLTMLTGIDSENPIITFLKKGFEVQWNGKPG